MKKNKAKTSFWQKLALIIGGIFLTLVVLEIILRLAGFIILSIQEHKNRLAFSKNSSYRIMCLGESTTQNQYPKFLEEALNQRSPGIKFSVIDKGASGGNTLLVLDRLIFNLDMYNPNIVVAMIGINDSGPHMAYKGDPARLFGDSRVRNLLNLTWLNISAAFTEKGTSGPEANYCDSGDGFSEKEQAFKEAIISDPLSYRAHVELGKLYRDYHKTSQAEETLKKAIELNPSGDWAYLELGRLYRKQSIFSDAEKAFKKAIELGPYNDRAYFELALLYRDKQKNFSLAEGAFKKAIKLNPDNNNAYCELGYNYYQQGDFLRAEESFQKAASLSSHNDRAYSALSMLYRESGKPELAEEYAEKAKVSKFEYCTPDTVANYRKLKNILDSRGIRLVCVQYPMRSIAPLKEIFKDNPHGIIFVDNEKVFKDAVTKSGYREYFIDAFAGDFGHCTPKGNQLLAENIADAVLKELFK